MHALKINGSLEELSRSPYQNFQTFGETLRWSYFQFDVTRSQYPHTYSRKTCQPECAPPTTLQLGPGDRSIPLSELQPLSTQKVNHATHTQPSNQLH